VLIKNTRNVRCKSIALWLDPTIKDIITF
jgi:hypothetical protein